MSAIERLEVGLAGRPYDILVGSGLLAEAGRRIRERAGDRRLVVVADATVARHHLEPLMSSLAAAGLAADSIVLPPGERTKDIAHYAALADDILGRGVDRRTLLVALGGGVIGDLVGFVAATLLRGIDFVQVPTTLLAQVDSSVGGKTGINTAHGKNLLGAFHQPILVLADTGTLATLPPREVRAGYAEIVKYGLIRDRDFFEWLERHGAALVAGDEALRRAAIVRSCAHKAAVVAADEREQGERALLNFGHTFGHALEAETHFSDALLHGEAVAVGMALAFRFSARRGLCAEEESERARRHLESVGLPTSPAALGRELPADRLVAHMRKDKKAERGRLTFILARGIGDAFVARDVPAAEVEAFLAGTAAPDA
jgi:3-dehydroquinate synthase